MTHPSPPPSKSGSVKLPAIGSVSKRTATIYAVAAVAVIGIAVWRHQRAVSINATTDVAPVGDASTDDAALSGDYSGYNAASGSLFGSGYTGAGPSENTDTTTTTVSPQNNAQWSQAATDYLANTIGLDSSVVSQALGAYLSGSAVNDAQNSIIQQAIAAQGQPPQSGVNGFPPSIHHVPAAKPTVPVTAPKSPAKPVTSVAKLPPPSIHAVTRGKSHFVEITHPVTGAATYVLFKNGAKVNTHTSGSFQITPNAKNKANYHVDAVNGRVASQPSNYVSL